MKKTIVSVILILALMFSMTVGSFADNNILDNTKDLVLQLVKLGRQFSDAAEHWASQYIARLYDLGTMNGFPDGTFKPDNSIKVGEFTKILVSSLGHKNLGNSTEGHWALNYILKAEALKLIKSGEFSNYDKEINRGEMARMIIRALDENMPSNISEYAKQIKDYNSIPSKYQDFVLKAYVKGIITGYSDNTFKYDRSATRAEASTMIMRLLDKNERKVPELAKDDVIVIYGKEVPVENKEIIPYYYKVKETLENTDGTLRILDNDSSDFIAIILMLDGDKDNYDNSLDVSLRYKFDNGIGEEINRPYSIIIRKRNENTKEITKELLKVFYPNEHEKAYKDFVGTIYKGTTVDKKYDNKIFFVKDFPTGSSIRIGR